MARFKLTPLARQDLAEIRAYIAQDNPQASMRYLQAIREKCRLLAHSPELGVRREEYLGLYKFPAGSHLIFYRPTDDGILVVRVLHAARDIPNVL